MLAVCPAFSYKRPLLLCARAAAVAAPVVVIPSSSIELRGRLPIDSRDSIGSYIYTTTATTTFHGFSWIFMDSNRFSWILRDLVTS